MVRVMAGAAVLVAGLGLVGTAGAQGFSSGGAGGVAALRGTTASPGTVGGGSETVAAGGADPAAGTSDPAAGPRRRMAPTDIDFTPRDGRSGTFGLPF